MNTFATCFSGIFFNEAYKFKTLITQVMTFLQGLNQQFHMSTEIKNNLRQRLYKWFISGTSIDISPGDFEGLISTL